MSDYLPTGADVMHLHPTAVLVRDYPQFQGLANGSVLFAQWDGNQLLWPAGLYKVSYLFVPNLVDTYTKLCSNR